MEITVVTRVLQVLPAFDRSSLPLYVGSRMDVFIDAPRAGEATSLSRAK